MTKPFAICVHCGTPNFGHCHYCEIIGIAAETMIEVRREDEQRRRELLNKWRRASFSLPRRPS